MNVMDLGSTVIKDVSRGYKRKKPLVLTLLAACCGALAVVNAYRYGSEIKEGLDHAKEEFAKAETGKEKAVAVVEGAAEVAWPVAKVVVPEVISIVAMTESYKESSRRILAFATMAAGSQIEKEDIRKAMREVVGQKKADQIEEKAAEEQFKRMGIDEVVDYNDSDMHNPDIFYDPETGAVWRDKYINVLNAISAYFTEAKTGGEEFYAWSELYDKFDYNKDGEAIRRGNFCKKIGVNQSDLQKIEDVQDFIRIIQVGQGRYKLVRQPEVKLRNNPNESDEDLDEIWDDHVKKQIQKTFGDGVWNGSLDPSERV